MVLCLLQAHAEFDKRVATAAQTAGGAPGTGAQFPSRLPEVWLPQAFVQRCGASPGLPSHGPALPASLSAQRVSDLASALGAGSRRR